MTSPSPELGDRAARAAARRRRNAVGWAALAVVVVTAFAIGVFSGRTPRTNQQRVADLSEEIACPVCGGESVAQSNAPAAVNIRSVISQQVDAGRTNDEIRAYLARQYGEDQLLRPRGEGVSALVWVLPVMAVVAAAAGLVVAFRRWSHGTVPAPTDEDRELVARFLAADDVGEVVGEVPGQAPGTAAGDRAGGEPSRGDLDGARAP